LSSLDSFSANPSPISKLPKRVLGKTGVDVPIFGLGADGMVTDTTDADKLLSYLEEVLNSGITFFYTAYI
jgi:aryl-alcohol dehydrogenase-like predicted oxidoreductase